MRINFIPIFSKKPRKDSLHIKWGKLAHNVSLRQLCPSGWEYKKVSRKRGKIGSCLTFRIMCWPVSLTWAACAMLPCHVTAVTWPTTLSRDKKSHDTWQRPDRPGRGEGRRGRGACGGGQGRVLSIGNQLNPLRALCPPRHSPKSKWTQMSARPSFTIY